MRKFFVAMFMSLMLALSVTACSDEPKAAEVVRGTNADDEQAEVTPLNEDEAEPEAEGQGTEVFQFGQPVEVGGVTVTISKPEAFTPTEYAAGGEGYKHKVKFRITLVNTSDKPYDPSLVYGTVQSGNREGEEIFDELEPAPMTTLLPGREATWEFAFGVDDPNDIVLEFTPDLMETALFVL